MQGPGEDGRLTAIPKLDPSLQTTDLPLPKRHCSPAGRRKQAWAAWQEVFQEVFPPPRVGLSRKPLPESLRTPPPPPVPWDWSWGNRLGAKDRGLGVPPPTDTCYKALCDLQVASAMESGGQTPP